MSNSSSPTASASAAGEGSPRRSAPDGSRTRRALAAARERLPDDARPGATRRPLGRVAGAAALPARVAAFWAAVTLPFLQVALLMRGLSTPAETRTFAVLLGVNLLALVAGHSHRRE